MAEIARNPSKWAGFPCCRDDFAVMRPTFRPKDAENRRARSRRSFSAILVGRAPTGARGSRESQMLVGEKTVLTTLDPGNAETARGWLNDFRVNRYLLVGQVPITAEQEWAFYDASEAVWAAGTAYRFEVHVAEDGRYIGNCGLEHVDMLHRDASAGIVIGDLEAQDHGYGRDALITLLRFAYDTLGLHRVQIECHATNERGAHLYRSLGFAEVGSRRDAVFTDGAFVDELVFDMLEDEWRSGAGA